jgi:methylthioribose-1-phosphate isomerase
MEEQEGVWPIRWDGDTLRLLDQRLLPREVVYREYQDPADVAEAIRSMVVRGAPAIGVAAAYGIALAARGDASLPGLERRVTSAAALLKTARPTAINLAWAIDRMMACFRTAVPSGNLASIAATLGEEADAIFREDLEGNRRIGRYGSALLGESSTILTHCNAGALATAGYGTALGVVRAAREAGKKIAVFAGETRPYLQGARLTAWELQREGIDVTLITDNMAGHFFQKGTFDAVIVGADRIAANGDVANKIGTYTIAVLAQAHSVPFYVAAPVSTVDLDCPDGSAIPIEERSADEVVRALGWDEDGRQRRVDLAPEGIRVRHPAFDVTPASLITAIITDRGVVRPPFAQALRQAVSTTAARS